MFVGWPTGPVARVGECETEEKPTRLDVFSDDDVDLPLLAGSASLKTQRGIRTDRGVGNKLWREWRTDRSGKLGNVDRGE
jgi:hypothetical protein